ncbi:DNA helicase [Thermogemmatispora aurantia]|uniref:DNA 3'-5' helicase n=1 Tax=Thermogemmatispora aurantia TaxID=2045279 RepID=A0A5J4KFU7_9CHLR|nr:UvrD-helicase domain-containing protein [Thermogemmatispora aurantia]GER85642.1 DNA helicase [Thermogemmatispora aurantia]
MPEHTELEQELLAGLNGPQREAVTTTEGPLLILAGPGSGKTRVITHRIAYLVRCRGVRPWHILAVTFTNKAAREMQERLEKLVGLSEAREMYIGTFHAICARVLRAEADLLAPFGLTRSFVILDTDDQAALIKQALRDLDLDEKQYRVSLIHALISRAKNAMLSPYQMAEQARRYTEEVAARVYRRYQQLLRSNNSVDFDDLLMLTEQLWRTESEVLARYQQRWQYIHVDEFQDCNVPQYKLIRLLGRGSYERPGGSGNVCVVGDDDQMIYSWRGASAENVQAFERDFPEARIILLEQNYRSTQHILDAAQCVVRRNTARKEKRLWTALGQGEKLIYHEAYNDEAEGLYVADEILKLLARGEVAHRGEIAVMYRTNAQSRALEEQFLRANIPYKVIGSRKFYERKEVKDMLAYLRLLLNPHDDLSLQRIINVPNRKIGPKSLGELQRWAREEQLSLYDALQRSEDHPTLGRAAKNALQQFAHLLAELRSSVAELRLPELLDRVAERTGYGPELRASPEGEERWSNILELRRVAEDYAEIETSLALELFLENVALVGGADVAQTGEDGTLLHEEDQDAVTLITLHAAKGLEFPVVFIVGLDEGILPHGRSIDSPEQLEEERRLAYVGFTRAMRRLYLVRARRRSYFGDVVYTEPSRFLADIPPDLFASSPGSESRRQSSTWERGGRYESYDHDHEDYGSRRVYGGAASRPRRSVPADTTFTPSSADVSSTPAAPRFQPGDRVLHHLFGQGIVLKSELESGSEFVEVQFQGKHGKKRLSLDYARLERLP